MEWLRNKRMKEVTNSSPNCLRCSNVALAPLPVVSQEINFYECPWCHRHYAQKPGRSLTFRWLHPISLVLYGFNNSLQKDSDYAPHVAREIAKGRSAEQIDSFRREIELELEQPSQPVREILGTEASEETCREFLVSVVSLLGSAGQTDTTSGQTNIFDRKVGDVVVIAVSGRLADGTPEVEEFDKRALELVGAAAARGNSVVFDFSALIYISSVGLRVLYKASKHAKAAGTRIGIASMSSLVDEKFRISKFNLIIPIYPTVGEAIAAVTLPTPPDPQPTHFKCPACAVNTLKITRSIELLPDTYNDELALQTVQCGSCKFRGAAVYEESRHGSLDSESWRHNGYPLGDAEWGTLEETINRCPSPRNKNCKCMIHVTLCKVDNGRHSWEGLLQTAIKLKKDFKMQYDATDFRRETGTPP